MSNEYVATFHDALTGETITRPLTPEEIEALPKHEPVEESAPETPEPTE